MKNLKPSLSLTMIFLLLFCATVFAQKGKYTGISFHSHSEELDKELRKRVCNLDDYPDLLCQIGIPRGTVGMVELMQQKGKIKRLIHINSTEMTCGYATSVLIDDDIQGILVHPDFDSLVEGIRRLLKPSLREAARK
jgi:hypothetical protein